MPSEPIDPPNGGWPDTNVVKMIDLEQIDTHLFRSRFNERNGNGALFGGQILSQSLAAAYGTVRTGRPAHSLHGYFLRPGDGDRPVIYQVDATRDGGRFSTRRVVAMQGSVAIFHMECSFHAEEPGWEHQIEAAKAPLPETLQSMEELVAEGKVKLPSYFVQRFSRPGPIEVKPVDVDELVNRIDQPFRQVWLRVPSAAQTDDPALHQQLLAYLSDYWLSGAAMTVHSRPPEEALFVASLDHAMWFHRPARADEWLLYDTDSPSAGNGTGLSRGIMFDRDGRLVASVVQEALFRQLRVRKP